MVSLLDYSGFGKGLLYLYHITLYGDYLYTSIYTLYGKANFSTFFPFDKLHGIFQAHTYHIHRIFTTLSYLEDHISYF